jgi:hypothetical protein
VICSRGFLSGGLKRGNPVFQFLPLVCRTHLLKHVGRSGGFFRGDLAGAHRIGDCQLGSGQVSGAIKGSDIERHGPATANWRNSIQAHPEGNGVAFQREFDSLSREPFCLTVKKRLGDLGESISLSRLSTGRIAALALLEWHLIASVLQKQQCARIPR